MIWAFDVEDIRPDFSRRYFANALKHEILLRPIGNTVYLMPPYVLDDDTSAFLAQGTLRALDETLKETSTASGQA